MNLFCRFFGRILILVLALQLAGCDRGSEVVEPAKKTLVMGTSADYPPFEFIKDQQIVGFDVELAEIVANRLGYSLYMRDISFPGLIPALKTGRIDFSVSSFARTPEREKEVDFSVSYYTPAYAILYRKGNPIDVMHLSGKSLGVQLGTSMELFLQARLKKENFKVIALTRTLPMIQDLKLKRLDGILLEEAQAKVFVGKNKEFDYYPFTNDDYGYAMAFPKNSKLKEQFDEVLIRMRDSGELEDLKKKWLF